MQILYIFCDTLAYLSYLNNILAYLSYLNNKYEYHSNRKETGHRRPRIKLEIVSVNRLA